MLTEVIVELSRLQFWASGVALPDYGDSDYSDISKTGETKKAVTPKKHKKGYSLEDEEWYAQQKEKQKKNETLYYPCDKKSELYVLQQDFILHNRGYQLDVATNDSR